MTGAAIEDGGHETAMLHGLAGLSPAALRATPAQKIVRWEDFDYRVDPAAAEAARLREVRNRQGGNTLDTALAVVRAELLLSASPSADNRRAATRLLREALTSLEAMEEDEPTTLRTVDVIKIVEQARQRRRQVRRLAHRRHRRPSRASQRSPAGRDAVLDRLRALDRRSRRPALPRRQRRAPA